VAALLKHVARQIAFVDGDVGSQVKVAVDVHKPLFRSVQSGE